ARTEQGSHSTLLVRAFRLLQSDSALRFRLYASNPALYFPIGMPAIPVSPACAGSVPSFSASSIASRCTCAFVCAAIRSSLAGFASCRLHRSDLASRECRPLRSPLPLLHSCLVFDSCALLVSSLLYPVIADGREYIRLSR